MKNATIKKYIRKIVGEAIKFFVLCCMFMVVMSICSMIENMNLLLLLAAIIWLLLANFALGIYYDICKKPAKATIKKEFSRNVH